MSGPSPACILVRHAHAEWPAYRGRDFDRPLTERGMADAQVTGAAIRAAGLLPRRIIASPARRTEQTARILLEQLQLGPDALEFRESLYNAGASALQTALQTCTADGTLVLMVAHNPGVSDLAQLLSGDPQLRHFSPGEWRAFDL